MTEPIAFIDLVAQQARLRRQLDSAIARVLDHGRYVLGPEVDELEAELARRAGVRHAITCANGTDAMELVLLAEGVGPGDAVFVPAFTFTSTAEVVALAGATPVFVDVDAVTFNMDPASLDAAIAAVRAEGALVPRCVIAVDLFGQPADYPAIENVCSRHGLWLMEDAAQSFGARLGNRAAGAFGRVATTSFYPAKPLGCYGDGGAVFTSDDDLATRLVSLRQHGQGTDKYDNIYIGMNSRLDTLQAVVLLAKLSIFDDEIAAREAVAQRYAGLLAGLVAAPRVAAGATSVWAQYTVVAANRDVLQAGLKARGVPSVIYYPRALTQQTAYRHFPSGPGGCPVSDRLAGTVLSLPMHPYLTAAHQQRIADALGQVIAGDASAA
ncbi:MAG: DegT/DnrJ/EryC1/StrS family aminotransferase [Alphaproteobacteria bacterium]